MGRSMLAVALLLIAGATFAGSARAKDGGAAGLRPWISLRFPGTQWITTGRLKERMTAERSTALVLLDIRTSSEFDVSHLAGARRMDPDADDLDAIDLPRDTPIIVYCSVGYRSAAVARRLGAAGFENVHNLEGGIFQWANEGRAIYRGPELATKVHPYNDTWGRLLDPHLHP